VSITRRLMKPGAFTVQLKDGTPKSIMSAIDKFDHVVITRNRLLPIDAYTDANILAQAQYSGPIESLSRTAKTLEGFDLSYWLGTPDGRGDLLDVPVTRTAGTLSQWAGDLIPSSLSTGTITNTGTSTLTNTYQWVTRREAFDAMCRAVGAEWRVNPDGTVDAALATTLFTSATPEIIITRRPQGPDGALRGIEVANITTNESAATYITKAIVVGDALELGSATGSTTYKDFRNNNVVMEGLVNAPAEEAPSAVATAVLAERNAIRRELTLTSRGYNITRFVEPGDWAYVWDEEASLVDQANQVIYNGELITPIKLRVYAVTFPVQEGVGVYVRRSGATPTYTDVTDWVEWENGDVRWEVGAANLPASQGAAGTAFLGANPEILARASGPAGFVANATATAITGIGATTTDITAATVTWTAEVGRQYKVSAHFQWVQRTAPGQVTMRIVNLAGTTLNYTQSTAAVNEQGATSAPYVFTPVSGGSQTIKLAADTNAGTVDVAASTTILVEDIGPA
jgi:hypothetical protein